MTLQLLFFGSIPNSDSIRTAKFLMLIINSTIVRVNLVIPQPAIGDRMDVQTEIVSQEKQFRKHVALAAGSLMLTLAMWALASPLGATPDEWLHLGSIYCANGVDGELCHKISSENVLTASADIDQSSCLTTNTADLSLCDDPKTGSYLMASSSYPKGYYRVMNVFTPLFGSTSVIAMRLFNGLLAAVFLIFQVLLIDKKKRIAWLTSFTFTLVPMSIFLISSVHPHAWGIIGCAHGWMFLITAFGERKTNRLKQVAGWVMWTFCGLMCLFSRYDVFLMFLATTLITAIFTNLRSDVVRIKTVIYAALLTLVGSVAVVFLVPPSSTLSWLPFHPSIGQYTNQVWITAWVVRFISIPVEILGSGGIGHNAIIVPQIVSIIGIMIIGMTIAFALIKTTVSQIATGLISIAILFYCILLLNNLMYRDLENLNGRYVIVFIPFMVGIFVFLSKSPVQMMEIRTLRFFAIALLTIAHSISLHSVLGHFVDSQSGSLLPIRVGETGWWWVGFPLGPNFVWALGSIAFLKFLTAIWSIVPTVQISIAEVVKS